MIPTNPTWRDMDSAPKDATWIRVLLEDGAECRAHWACGGGEEQPPFKGWFVARGDYFSEVEPLKWMPEDLSQHHIGQKSAPEYVYDDDDGME